MPSQPAGPPPTWSLVVPVKVLAHAKSRLGPLAGPHRPALALAMAQDTVAAALDSAHVARVIVVTDDPVARNALTGAGAIVIPDAPGAGLNAALRHGAAVASSRWPRSGMAALAADLPALRPAELSRALGRAAAWPEAFVADAAGSGTTLYAARPGTAFRPRFGPGSAARHHGAGAAGLAGASVDGLRRDVDEPADLAAAAALGLGPRTAALLRRLAGREWAEVRRYM